MFCRRRGVRRSSTAVTVVATVGACPPGSAGESGEGGGGDVERERDEGCGEPAHEGTGVDAAGDAAAGEDAGEGGDGEGKGDGPFDASGAQPGGQRGGGVDGDDEQGRADGLRHGEAEDQGERGHDHEPPPTPNRPVRNPTAVQTSATRTATAASTRRGASTATPPCAFLGGSSAATARSSPTRVQLGQAVTIRQAATRTSSPNPRSRRSPSMD